MNSPRRRPSPCSPLREPRYFLTSVATSEATVRKSWLPSFVFEDGPKVDLTAAGMSVVHGMKAMLFQNGVGFADIGGEILNIHCGVFDHRHGLFIAGDVAEQAEASLAEGPDLFCVVAEEQGKMIAQAGRPQVSLQL